MLRDRRSLANDGMFMIVVTVDKQTGAVIGRPEIITRGFVHLNERDPLMEEAVRPGHRGDRRSRATTSARSRCSRPRSRTACRASCTSRRSAGRWSSRSWSRSDDGDPAALGAPARRRPRRTAQARVEVRRPVHAGGRPFASSGLIAARPGRDHAHRARPARGGQPDRLVDATRSRRGSGPMRWLLPFVLLAVRLVHRVGPAPPDRAGA